MELDNFNIEQFLDLSNYATDDITRLAEANGKFSCCLMNPPYDKNLHLKFLEKVIQISDEVVSVQPCDYLLDIPAVLGMKNTTFQRFEELSKHITDLEVIPADEAIKLFGARTFVSFGIYSLDQAKHEVYKSLFLNDKRKSVSIFKKTIKPVFNGKVDNIKNHIDISVIHGHPGKRDEFDIITPQYELVKSKKPKDMTEEEFKNWHQSCNTKFMKYCNLLVRQGQHLQPQWLPFMEDYKQKWDDNRFYKYFKLDNKEIELIEKVMEKYV